MEQFLAFIPALLGILKSLYQPKPRGSKKRAASEDHVEGETQLCTFIKGAITATPHTLRHTSVTWRLLKGVPLRDVAEYVGMSEKMVRDRYGHSHPDHQKRARSAL